MKSSIKGGNLTKKQFPNIITACRMVFSAAILLCPVFSPAFWTLYIAAGLSDMLDGALARKFNAVSLRACSESPHVRIAPSDFSPDEGNFA